MMLIGPHGKKNFVSDFAINIGGVIGILYDKRGTEFLGFHVVFFDEFPVDETGVSTTVDKGVFLDAVFPLL